MEKVEFIIGKMIEFSEDDRQQIYLLASKTAYKVQEGDPGVATLVLQQFKIVQAAIARSHAN